MQENIKIEGKGGNQYEVTLLQRTEMVDLDGITVVSDEDYTRLQEAGLDDDTIICPAHAEAVGDEFFCAAVYHALNYSGFDVDEYILNHSN